MTDVHLFPDVEESVVGVLDGLRTDLALLADLPSCTVGTNVPREWKPTDAAHLLVRVDGGSAVDMPIAGRVTVSLVARASTTRRAKRLAIAAQALLASRHDLISAVSQSGPITARDEQTDVELASTTVLVVARTVTA